MEVKKCLVGMLVVLLLVASGAQAQPRPQLSPRAAQALQTDDPSTVRKYWLFLDSSSVLDEPVAMTEKARARRAKVDPENFLVEERDRPIRPEILDSIRQTGAVVKNVSRWLRGVSVEATPEQMSRIIQKHIVRGVDLVSNYSSVRSPEPSDRGLAPDAALVELDYGLSLIQNQIVKSVKLHKAGYTGKGVLIAMFDSGFMTTHHAFDSTSILATWDFINGDPDVGGADCLDIPQHNHGTATFGAVGGWVPDTLVGIAFDADFALAKTEITCGGTEIKIEEDNWIAAAEWADSLGADIISASLGYNQFQDSGSYVPEDLDGNTARITIVADIAASRNILVVTAAGNERGDANWPYIIFPADGDSVMAVGAVRPDSFLASFSSPGPTSDGRIKPDIVTQGQAVYTASTVAGFGYSSGTSLSTPLAAGAAALAFDFDNSMTAMQYLDLARQTASRVRNLRGEPDNNYGFGLLDAGKAADIIRIAIADTLFVDTLAGMEFHVQTQGRTTEIPSVSAFDLPVGAILIDSGNGRAGLFLNALPGGVNSDTIGLVAEITNFADTTYTVLSSSTPVQYPTQALAYPNPFARVVTILHGTASGRMQAVTIFNSAGEKVWERVNISPGSSDTNRIEWDGRNDSGEIVAPGVYIAYVQSELATERVKLLKVE